MTMLDMMWNTSQMPEILQFQAHHWHPAMQENAENPSPKDESVVGGRRKLTSDSRKI